MSKRLALMAILCSLSVSALAGNDVLMKNTVILNGVVAASSCSIRVDSGASNNSVIDFGVYNRIARIGRTEVPFQVKLFEQGSTLPGCSAFLTGRGLVKLQFGDASARQLDKQGVVTCGAGDRIRVDIRSTDTNYVSSVATITSQNSVLSYPIDFAAKGVFGFVAKTIGLDEASSGEYHGSLSLVVSYQ